MTTWPRSRQVPLEQVQRAARRQVAVDEQHRRLRGRGRVARARSSAAAGAASVARAWRGCRAAAGAGRSPRGRSRRRCPTRRRRSRGRGARPARAARRQQLAAATLTSRVARLAQAVLAHQLAQVLAVDLRGARRGRQVHLVALEQRLDVLALELSTSWPFASLNGRSMSTAPRRRRRRRRALVEARRRSPARSPWRARRRARSRCAARARCPASACRRRRSRSSRATCERAVAAELAHEVLRPAAGCRRGARAAAAPTRGRPRGGSRGPRGNACAATSARRLRLVAATTRTATLLVASCRRPAAPRACRARAAAPAARSSASSPISSRNSVPPSASSNAPAPIGDRAGERAAHVAEQRRLDQLARHGAAVEHDERAVACAGCGGGSPRRSAPCRCRSRPRSARSRRWRRRRRAAGTACAAWGRARPASRSSPRRTAPGSTASSSGTNLRTVWPIVTSAPKPSVSSLKREPWTNEPLVEPRSRSDDAVRRRARCRGGVREIVGSDSSTSQPPPEPSVSGSSPIAIDSPRSGPLTTSSRPRPDCRMIAAPASRTRVGVFSIISLRGRDAPSSGAASRRRPRARSRSTPRARPRRCASPARPA